MTDSVSHRKEYYRVVGTDAEKKTRFVEEYRKKAKISIHKSYTENEEGKSHHWNWIGLDRNSIHSECALLSSYSVLGCQVNKHIH